MTRFRLFVFSLLGAFIASTAHGQSFGPPVFSVGDEWTFTNRTQKVVKVDRDVVVFQGALQRCPACLYYYHVKEGRLITITMEDGSTPDSGTMWLPVGSDWKWFDFPLEVNKTWHISAQGLWRRSPENFTVDFTVEKYDEVVTKAGTFKAFKIRRDWTRKTMDASRQVKWTEYTCFAPEVKVVVKFTGDISAVSPSTQNFELVSYKLK